MYGMNRDIILGRFQNQGTVRSRARLILSLLCICCFCAACTPGSVEQFVFGEQEKAKTITALPLPETAPNETVKTGAVPNLVLESGNHWITGIPGFGENALAAFSGDYRIPDKSAPIRIWLTREFLYYTDWNSRNVFGLDTLQKMLPDGRVIAADLGGLWNIIMLLPAELNQEEEDRLITIFTGKFNGFTAQTHNLSLPALIPY